VVTSAKVSVAVLQASLAVGVVNDGVAGQVTVLAAGSAPIVGGVLSTTNIVCDAVAVLLQASFAVLLLVLQLLFAQLPAVVTSAKVSVVVLQASLAVGVV